MEGPNDGNVEHVEEIGDGEVINEAKSSKNYPGVYCADSSDCHWWDYTVADNNNILEIPRENCFIFINRNQPKIMLIDHFNGDRYPCDIHFGATNMEDISIGNGWEEFLRTKEVKKGDVVYLLLYGDNPHNIHVFHVDRN
ncbi:hypothetical protein L195_g001348 [Trifolium pratense]|uniref:B3 domain-containing protein n=1 Tax=Trifolium pratense TaxID=57577 RepID=A0A2K3NPF9_TRIPR|nr:hypothetical protein L195_g001348 [Trifolium pratense]